MASLYDLYKSKPPKGGLKSLYEMTINSDDIIVAHGYASPLEVRLKYSNIPYDALVIISDKILDKEEIEKNKNDYYNEDYAIFSGGKIRASKRETKIEILRNMKLFSQIMYQMLDVGYLIMENNGKIDDWIPTFEHPILKLFIEYHQFETSNGSYTIEDEFMINPWFRKNILLTMMKIVSNFIINNKMITKDEVKEIGNWTEMELWMGLKDKVKIFA